LICGSGGLVAAATAGCGFVQGFFFVWLVVGGSGREVPGGGGCVCRCYTAAAAVEVLRRRQQLGLEEKVL
jgi:hypothetical protein